MTEGVVNIRGKEYHTVAKRVSDFRQDYSDWTIETQLISQDDDRVIMKALILDGERLVATGYAEEVRGSTNINTTSALENCETSAIGRALAAFGFAGTEYASADEVGTAIMQQQSQSFLEYAALVREHWDSLAEVKAHLTMYEAALQLDDELAQQSRLSDALATWREVGQDVMTKLWRAPSKGGVFTTRERELLKVASNEAYKMEHGNGQD